MTLVAEVLAGRPGARLAVRLGMPVARDTLIRLLRAAEVAGPGPVRALGLDEFALLKRHKHATLLVDLEARRPIDVLPGREAELVARWLADHPEVEIVCRDRASAYSNPRELHQMGENPQDASSRSRLDGLPRYRELPV